MAEQGKDKEQLQGQLKHSICLFQAMMYDIGLILGAGIYVIIDDVAGIAGNAMWISFIIAAFIALLTGLSYAELSSIFPKSAAEYIFAKNIFGNDLAASIIGCLIIFVAVVSAATVAIGFSQYVHIFLPQISTGVTDFSTIALDILPNALTLDIPLDLTFPITTFVLKDTKIVVTKFAQNYYRLY